LCRAAARTVITVCRAIGAGGGAAPVGGFFPPFEPDADPLQGVRPSRKAPLDLQRASEPWCARVDAEARPWIEQGEEEITDGED
jgi:hypothetical protein